MPKVSRAKCDRKPAWPAFAMVGGVKPQGSTAKSRIDLGDSVAESAAQRWAQLAEPPCAEAHARGWGRGRPGRLPPIPIYCAATTTFPSANLTVVVAPLGKS